MLVFLVALALFAIGELWRRYPKSKPVRWFCALTLTSLVLSPFAYLKWLSLQMDAWKRDFASACRVGNPLSSCVEFIGHTEGVDSQGRYQKLFWGAGDGIFVEPKRNNSTADWGVQAKDGIITAVLNLDKEENRPIWEKLAPEGY